MADSSQTRVAIIPEVTFGTTPATPVFVNQRFVSESLNANIETVVSNEIRPDRNVADIIQVAQSASGGLDFELSYGSFDTILEGLFFSTWSSNVLKNGVTAKSFTIEKTFETGATDQFHRFTGAMVNSMTLNMATSAIVTGSFDFLAAGFSAGTSIISGATYTGANTNDVINAAASFASLAITGVTSPQLTALDLTITNNLSLQQVLGSLNSRGVTSGRCQVTGNMTVYFENAEIYALFLAASSTDLTFKLGGSSSKNYVFVIPKIKFNSATVVAGGNDQPLLVQLAFTGLYGASDAASIKVTRTA
jgi:hypothetical protein